jgi:hypothetical protein
VTVKELPKRCRLISFPLLSESSIAELGLRPYGDVYRQVLVE